MLGLIEWVIMTVHTEEDNWKKDQEKQEVRIHTLQHAYCFGVQNSYYFSDRMDRFQWMIGVFSDYARKERSESKEQARVIGWRRLNFGSVGGLVLVAPVWTQVTVLLETWCFLNHSIVGRCSWLTLMRPELTCLHMCTRLCPKVSPSHEILFFVLIARKQSLYCYYYNISIKARLKQAFLSL